MSDEFPDLSALKAGDGAAWDQAFRHLWPIALRTAHHLQACPEEAEDAASQAMIEFVRKIDCVKNVNHARALVATFARNCAIGSIRREAAIKRSRPENFELAPAETLQSSELTEIEQVEMVVLLGQALAILEPVTRLILEEKFVHGLTCEEIHRRHSIPLGTVCTKLARGPKIVQAYLAKSPLLLKEMKQYLQ